MSTVLQVTRTFTVITLTATYSTISQLNLSPIFGSLVASQHHLTLTIGTLLAQLGLQSSVARLYTDELFSFIPVHAFNIPTLLHWPLFRIGSAIGPGYGPLFIESLTYLPILFLSYCVIQDCVRSWSRGLRYTGIGCSSLAFFAIQRWSKQLLSHFIGTNILITRWTLQILVATLYAITFPSKLLVAIVPSLLFSYNNMHAPLPRAITKINKSLQPEGFKLLERQESVTGYISVLEENKKSHFRMLRCDHSLLGGEWLVTSESKKHGITSPEPVYSVFTMLEAVRLMEEDGDKAPQEDRSESALVIGLGIGISPRALAAHGINTTAIELDPVVTEFAKKYFSLPLSVSVINKDVIDFVRTSIQRKSFDYIIHDVFTGGAEPVDLFTIEFLLSLYFQLKDGGAVAINYAGDLNMPSTALVVNNIFAAFGNCKVYRDNPPTKGLASDFVNIVVFCMKTEEQWHFREAVEADYLQSQARRHYLVPKLRVDSSSIGGSEPPLAEVLTRSNMNVMAEYQRKSAQDHWRIMRQVLPDAVWENW